MHQANIEGYTKAVDIWSVGILAAHLLSGDEPPGDEPSIQDYYLKIPQNPCWAKVTKTAKNFAFRLLIKDDTKRPSAKEALEHHWFAKPSHHGWLQGSWNTALNAWQPRPKDQFDVVERLLDSVRVKSPSTATSHSSLRQAAVQGRVDVENFPESTDTESTDASEQEEADVIVIDESEEDSGEESELGGKVDNDRHLRAIAQSKTTLPSNNNVSRSSNHITKSAALRQSCAANVYDIAQSRKSPADNDPFGPDQEIMFKDDQVYQDNDYSDLEVSRLEEEQPQKRVAPEVSAFLVDEIRKQVPKKSKPTTDIYAPPTSSCSESILDSPPRPSPSICFNPNQVGLKEYRRDMKQKGGITKTRTPKSTGVYEFEVFRTIERSEVIKNRNAPFYGDGFDNYAVQRSVKRKPLKTVAAAKTNVQVGKQLGAITPQSKYGAYDEEHDSIDVMDE